MLTQVNVIELGNYNVLKLQKTAKIKMFQLKI